jgi:uncharacterized protein
MRGLRVLAGGLAMLAAAGLARADDVVSPTPEVSATPEVSCGGKFTCVPIEQPVEVVSNLWVSAGTVRSFVFPLVDSFGGDDVDIPVTVIRGARPGPTLLLTASIHGDEMIGVPILLRLRETVKPEELAGIIVMLPIVNPFGFQRDTRYLPDRRDLNRFFPGNERGSLANRIAHRVFATFVLPSDYCIDFHTAASGRGNAPHVRADPRSGSARSLAQSFGGVVVLHEAEEGTLRYAATAAGVPTALFEGGEATRIDPRSVEAGVRGVENLLAALGMRPGSTQSPAPPLWLRYSSWIRSDVGGVMEPAVALGDVVQANQLLLTIRDALNGTPTEVRSPSSGIVMSMARAPVVQPGNALLRLGLIEPTAPPAPASEPESPE